MRNDMLSLNRRILLRALMAASGVAMTPPLFAAVAGAPKARVVVVGAGIGGATAAKYIRMFDPGIEVTVIEKNAHYIRPYGSTEVLTGAVTMDDLCVSYDPLKARDVKFVQDTAVALDGVKKVVTCKSGKKLPYDFLIVAPGVELMYEKYPGLTEEIADTKITCGWIPGAQTALLRKQLLAMPEDGTFLICPPPNPYRCPPGPYERAALLTEWTGKYKPRAKIIVADPKNGFTADITMLMAWNHLYGFMPPEPFKTKLDGHLKDPRPDCRIKWITKNDGGTVKEVDVKNMTVITEGAGAIKADVINIIPPMRAGRIALDMGLANETGFCPIDRRTFESTVIKSVYVLGDSSIADAMPKSGFSANTQAKVAARAIVETVNGRPIPEPAWANTCYALASDEWGMFVADTFRLVDGKIARTNTRARYQFLTAGDAERRVAARYLRSWIRTITADSFY